MGELPFSWRFFEGLQYLGLDKWIQKPYNHVNIYLIWNAACLYNYESYVVEMDVEEYVRMGMNWEPLDGMSWHGNPSTDNRHQRLGWWNWKVLFPEKSARYEGGPHFADNAEKIGKNKRWRDACVCWDLVWGLYNTISPTVKSNDRVAN